MKAILCPKYGPPEVLQLAEAKKPKVGKKDVLIQVKATSVTVADTRLRAFRVPAIAWIPARLFLGVFRPRKKIIGSELSGIVVETGSEVSRFRKGDEVFAETLTRLGAYAEFAAVAEDGVIAHKPANLSFAEAATMPVGARTALFFIRFCGVKPGKKVLIYGASGSVGSYAVQLAKHFGAEVTGVCSTKNLELVKSIGADAVIDYTREDMAQHPKKYDIIIEAVDKCPFPILNTLLKDDGTFINITNPLKTIPMMRASRRSNKKVYAAKSLPKTYEDLIEIKKLAEAGAIKPVIEKTYQLEEIVEAHRHVDSGRKVGNVAVQVSKCTVTQTSGHS
ncbi:MAG: NAD(P)-dependent alcohol dehydrogenase [Bacteroidetes bacterium]|nr:NAD(P)-dependent alcohol dehydrogenase [Bacteroidota bacterium]